MNLLLTIFFYSFLPNSQERSRFQQELNKMSELHEQKLKQYVDDAEKKHQMEMDEIEERKTNQINKLIDEHDESFREMRNYYNDITQNNLILIGNLKEQLEDLKGQLEKSEKHLVIVNNLFLYNVYFTFRQFINPNLIDYVSFYPTILCKGHS